MSSDHPYGTFRGLAIAGGRGIGALLRFRPDGRPVVWQRAVRLCADAFAAER